jgi:hypothetical protein
VYSQPTIFYTHKKKGYHDAPGAVSIRKWLLDYILDNLAANLQLDRKPLRECNASELPKQWYFMRISSVDGSAVIGCGALWKLCKVLTGHKEAVEATFAVLTTPADWILDSDYSTIHARVRGGIDCALDGTASVPAGDILHVPADSHVMDT